MRYRRYYVRETKNGRAVDVTSVGPIARGFGAYLWLVLAVAVLLSFVRYWYVMFPTLFVLLLLNHLVRKGTK